MIYKKYGKRCCDVILSIIGLPFFAMIFIPTAIAIKAEDHGPVFYNAPRLGKDGKTFKMYKFRSMKVNAPDIRNTDGTTFNAEDDLRLTKVGKIIRKTSIDETPQLINILKGEMSFIGPRPDLPEAITKYQGEEKDKLKVLPGITGYSQAYKRNNIEIHERFKEDLYYANNISLLFDIKIMRETLKTVFLRKNIFRNIEGKNGEN